MTLLLFPQTSFLIGFLSKYPTVQCITQKQFVEMLEEKK